MSVSLQLAPDDFKHQEKTNGNSDVAQNKLDINHFVEQVQNTLKIEELPNLSSQISDNLLNSPQNQIFDTVPNHNISMKQNEEIKLKNIHNCVLNTENQDFQKPLKDDNISEHGEDEKKINSQQEVDDASERLQNYLDLMDQSSEFSSTSSDATLLEKVSEKYSQSTLNIQTLLSSNNISVLSHQTTISSIKLHNIRHFANYEIVILDVCVGKFQKSVTIYNLLGESCFHSLKPFNSGSFGTIYLWNYLQKQFIVKCITKTSMTNFEQIFTGRNKAVILREILKEYMVAYIAGVLEIGPKVMNPFGFDIIVSRKCIEFFIQRLSLPQYHLQRLDMKFNQIKKSLLNLHLLNIVHNDIKPENIMYSQASQKLLFIDFGLSEYITKPIGLKIQTKFIGTYQFSSPQMQKLLFQNEVGKIDLYYNDAFCLNMALNKLFQIQKTPETHEKNSKSLCSSFVTDFLHKIYLKFLVYQENIKDVITLSNIIELKRKFQLQQQILEFVQKLSISPELKLFYHESIHYSVKDLPKFRKLQDVYVRNLSATGAHLQLRSQDFSDFADLYEHFQKDEDKEQTAQTTFRQRSMTKLQKKMIIMSGNKSVQDQKVFALYLDIVNFLKRNQFISIEQKTEVSIAMIQKFNIKKTFCYNVQTEINSLLQPILQCIFHLMRYCVTEPLNKWKRQNFVKIASMMIILGWYIPEEQLKDWRLIMSTSFSDIQQILRCYLEFMMLQRLALDRFFNIYNSQALKEISQMMLKSYQQDSDSTKINKSIYQHVLEQMQAYKNSSRGQNNSNQELVNIFISILQFDEHPQTKIEEKLDLLLKNIENLPYSIFQNKIQAQSIKIYLMYWIDIHYCKLRVQHEKQLKLLQKLKKITLNHTSTFQIHIFIFQLLSKYTILKNLSKIKEQLQLIEETINCPLISQNICLPHRFSLALMLGDNQKIHQILTKLQNKDFNEITDLNLYRHLSTAYQNTYFYVFERNKNPDQFFHVVYQKIQKLIHNFILEFHKLEDFRKSKQHRKAFCQLLRSVLSIGNKQNDFTLQSIAYQHSDLYLQIFQSLLKEYPDNKMIKAFIFSKMMILKKAKLERDACEFYEKDPWVKLSEFNYENYEDVWILIGYYQMKLELKTEDEDIYITKFRQLYDQMVEKGSFHAIFANKRIYVIIVKHIRDIKLTFEYFKLITGHLARSPSVMNTQLFVSYLKDFIISQMGRVKEMMYKPQLQEDQSMSPKKQNDKEDAKIIKHKRAIQVFEKIYGFIRSQARTCRIWQNPYIIVMVYCLSMATDISLKEHLKLHILTSKALAFMNSPARRQILQFFYWRMNYLYGLKQNARSSLNRYLIKMHLKHCFTKHTFENYVELRIRKSDWPPHALIRFPGYLQVRKKIYRYYDNRDMIERVNYVMKNDKWALYTTQRSISEVSSSEFISEMEEDV